MGRKIIDHIKRFDHYAIYVKDLAASVYFYGEIIGFSELKRPEFIFPGAWFDLGNGQELHLIEGESLIESGDKTLHFAFEVDNFDAVFEICKEHNLYYVGPQKRPDGPMQLFIKDNSGYFIEFTLKVFDEPSGEIQ